MPLLELLQRWFEQGIRLASWQDVETVLDKPQEGKIRFSTGRFTYTISADTLDGGGYLGCTCVERGTRRGCDLPDGTFCEATWAEIVQAITENEIAPTRPPGSRSR